MKGLLDLFFPPRCPGCRDLIEGAGAWCRTCRESVAEVPERRCARCAEPDVDALCAHCAAALPAFERAVVPFLYGGPLAEALHRFKYDDCPHYAAALASLGTEAARPALEWCTLIAPVPLHVARLRSRGYDQALLLARALADGVRRVEPRALRRVRATEPQVERDRVQRERNVAGAFAGEPTLAGARLLLVDDVLTTGATAHAAAAAALAAGAAAVRVFALARASWTHRA